MPFLQSEHTKATTVVTAFAPEMQAPPITAAVLDFFAPPQSNVNGHPYTPQIGMILAAHQPSPLLRIWRVTDSLTNYEKEYEYRRFENTNCSSTTNGIQERAGF